MTSGAVQSQLRRYLSASPAPTLVVDRNGEIVFVNRAFEDLGGHEATALLGTPIASVLPHFSDLRESGRAALSLRDRAGSDRSVSVAIEPLEEAPGAFIVVFQPASDVASADLERRVAIGERLASMGQIVGGVAHDFNNLLTAVYVNVALLRAGDLPAIAAASVDEIRAAAERGAALTRQLLGLAHQDADPSSIDPNAVITSTLGFLRRVIRPDIALSTALSPVPRIRMSATHLDQIIANLVLNARDAIDAQRGAAGVPVARRLARNGEIRVSTRAGGGRVEIVVEDDGAGLPADVRDRIFEPFVSTKAGGAGFGLSTVRRIVASAHGAIGAFDRDPRGARFVVSVPALEGEQPTPPPRAPSVPVRAPSSAPAGEHLLLVESDEWVRAAAKAALESRGYRVRGAGSVREAQRIVLFAESPFDLAIVDDVLTGGSGFALGQTLQLQIPTLAVLYTGRWSTEDEPPGPLLTKPYDIDELSQRVRETIDAFRSVRRE